MPRPLTYYELADFLAAIAAKDPRGFFMAMLESQDEMEPSDSFAGIAGTRILNTRERVSVAGLPGLIQLFRRCDHDDSPETLEKLMWQGTSGDQVTLSIRSRKVEITTAHLEFVGLCHEKLQGLRIRKFSVEMIVP